MHQTKKHQEFFTLTGRPKSGLSLKSALLRLQRARSLGASYLTFDQIEAGLLPHLPQLIQQSRALNYKKIVINSQGQGFSDYLTAKNLLAGNQHFLRICLALHSHQPNIHDHIMAQPGNFNLKLKAISHLTKLKSDLLLNLTLHSLNFSALNPYIDLLSRLQVKTVVFSFTDQCLSPGIDTVIPFIKQAIDYANSKNIHVGLIFIPFCLLDSYYLDYAVEFHQPDNLQDAQFLKQGYKSTQCRSCRHYAQCPGIWKKYYQQNGFHFKPVIS